MRSFISIRRLSIFLGLLLLAAALAACGSDAAPDTALEDPAAEPAAPDPEDTTMTTSDLDYPLDLPDGFRIARYASDLGEVRKIAFDDDGVLYVTIMNRTQPGEGSLLALPDEDGDGEADEVITVLDQIDRPHGLTFHEGSLYVSEPHRLHRIIDEDGDLQADDTEIIIDNMPAEGDHWARPFVFEDDGNILVAIGSSCNATCTESDPRRATIVRYAPDGSEIGPIAFGLRSVVDMAWEPGTDTLWAVNNGRDFVDEPDTVPDSALIVREGAHYGWPICYGDGTVDPEVAGRDTPAPPGDISNEAFCETEMTVADMVLPPHVAPLGVTFYTAEQFPERWQGGMFMAWHGAFDFANTNGYRVAFAPFEGGTHGEPESFISWVMPDESGWYGRPVGVTVGPEGSLYITDDFNGDILRVDYVGE
jgi:glucose/arabinose dehydrogenase